MAERYIMLVDDDECDVELALRAFERGSFEPSVRVFNDCAQAFEFLRNAADSAQPLPEMVVTDIKMPRMSGLDLMRAIKGDARLSKVPVAVLTSSGEERDRRDALMLGAALYLQKPMTAAEFSRIVTELNVALRSA